MKILIYHSTDLLGRVIEFCEHGRGSHAAFLRSDCKTIHEAWWPRVRDRIVMPSDRKHAEVFELEGISQHEQQLFEHLFDANLRRGVRYSVMDLIRFELNLPARDELHTFCSRYVMHCLRAILHPLQMPLVRIPDGDWASPRDLRISPRLHVVADFWKEH